MYTVRQHPVFSTWLRGIKDLPTRIRLLRRLEKAQRGILGDVKPVGSGVFEMREDFGPGWRMYYVKFGTDIVVMLGGGHKSSQYADISAAKRLARTLKQ